MVRDYPSEPQIHLPQSPSPISLQCSPKITKKLGLEAMNLVIGREREERGGAHTMDERRRSATEEEVGGAPPTAGRRRPGASYQLLWVCMRKWCAC